MNVETRINFFVIGAAKCGTTTLYSRLKDHPEVFSAPSRSPITTAVTTLIQLDFHRPFAPTRRWVWPTT